MAQLVLRGTMYGHTDCVTAIAAPTANPDTIVTASRDKSLILWKLTKDNDTFGLPASRFTGHSGDVNDVVVSADGEFALSASSDGDLRLWEVETGETIRSFVGHTDKVLSVALSADHRQIASASRDNSIKIWNTIGECKFSIEGEDAHAARVSCVRFSPAESRPTVFSGSWDKTVRAWNSMSGKVRATFCCHDGWVTAVAVSPDGGLCASGDDDGVVLVWDVWNETLVKWLDAGAVVNAVCFSPNRSWLCAATEEGIRVWDFEDVRVVADLESEMVDDGEEIYCTSLGWSPDGSILYSGYTDGVVRVWGVHEPSR